jgi:hypothetical protein
LDRTEPADDLVGRTQGRANEAAVAQAGVGDRAVRHEPSLRIDPVDTRHDRHADDYDGDVSRAPAGWDVDSPVQAEVFVVWLDGDQLALTGPDGPQPWILQLGPTEHPVEVVDRIVRDVVGATILVHSTSWRRDRDAVILSFVVVIDQALVGDMASVRIERAELARSAATAAPRDIAVSAVVEHGLRHLAWLVQDDPVVAAELPAAWRPLLAAYVPEPFRSLG